MYHKILTQTLQDKGAVSLLQAQIVLEQKMIGIILNLLCSVKQFLLEISTCLYPLMMNTLFRRIISHKLLIILLKRIFLNKENQT